MHSQILRAWMGVNAREEDSPFTAPAAPPYARLANFFADLADSFWRCACACAAQGEGRVNYWGHGHARLAQPRQRRPARCGSASN